MNRRNISHSMSRTICNSCLRPTVVCWCHCIKTLEHKSQVIIWQHPNEAGHPKGTALLLARCLDNCRVWVGEQASPLEMGVDVEDTFLVYPSNANDVETSKKGNAPKDSSTLILLDGTWRKSRKLFYSNLWLQQLPKLSLENRLSHYTIRKSESPNQLSTYEAACLALNQSHLITEDTYQQSQAVFTDFIDHMNQIRNRNK